MADFNIAFSKTMGIEGTYSNNPNDRGQETYCGISRRYHPNWNGWIIVDELKTKDITLLKTNLENHPELSKLVKDFYRDNYWNRFLGNEIADQDVADELFDTSVNIGVSNACKIFQHSLNLLDRNEILFKTLVVDGLIGNTTLHAFNRLKLVGKEEIVYLLKLMNILQGMHYINFMDKSSEQKEFCRGWLKRIEITKR
jgi:lysozyme family protein